MGPTASGKTDLAIDFANRFPSDLISVDSALVYKDMNIGTAKPEAEVLAEYPHALVDLISPEERYSAADFARDAKRCIKESTDNKRLPILVGGTMLYYRALLAGMDDLPETDHDVRAEFLERLEKEGSLSLHKSLAEVDPESAERIHQNDPQRIIRALEVYAISGKTLSSLQTHSTIESPYDCLKIVLLPKERSFLHERIAKRFDIMLNNGFIEEVEMLKARYNLHLDLPSMRSVGYRQAWQYLEGDLSFEEMKERGIIATRQLAKRQHTWLRKEPDINTLYIEVSLEEKHAEAATLIENFMNK